MGRIGTDVWWIFVVFVVFRMAYISVVSAGCVDPGRPIHGSRTVSRTSGGFPAGTVISFYCDALYTLVGVKKISCSWGKYGYYWSGKVPQCLSQGCPMPPPAFPHANITTDPVLNTKGSRVKYTCMDGYECDGCSTYMYVLCDKDTSRGYRWSGNFTCKKKTCGRPEYPRKGHGNYSLSVHGTLVYAHYNCSPGYVLLRSNLRLTTTMIRACNMQTGKWSFSPPTCVKTCNATAIQLDHGTLSRNPHYYADLKTYAYTQGVEVTFQCKDRYRLEGRTTRRCLKNGHWDGTQPRCVLNRCGSPDGEKNFAMRSTFNNSAQSGYPIWTTVTFACVSGYQLVGPSVRQCRPSERGVEWTEQNNPTCRKSWVTCSLPRSIPHGSYKPSSPLYFLNERVHYTCKDRYYLWGAESWTCSNSSGQGIWRSRRSCLDFCTVPSRVQADLKCLPLNGFDEQCLKTSGTHATFDKSGAKCQSDVTPTDKVINMKTFSNSGLDKMTIVVATAGSTLGALVVLLTALVCFRRFHRSRRFRHSTFRSRRYSDDDRIAIIAAYAGDVHFILPSYDEAISQVQSQPPPPFESVVQGAQDGGNQPAPDNNNPTVDEAGNHSGTLNSTADGASISASEANDSAANTREAGRPNTVDNQPINIVRNPLAEGLHAARETVPTDHVMSAANECGVNLSEESLDTIDIDSSPNNPSENLPSTSSEEDLTFSETRPLLANGRRDVML